MTARPWLKPLVPIYRLGLALSQKTEPDHRLRWPVISIGNLSTGGAGKTPLTIALAHALTARGVHVDVLSRGYGRTDKSTMRVQDDGSAEQYGDEPLLIARAANVPVYVAPKRYEAGTLAEAEFAPKGLAVHLLDDGFQHRQLHRDVDILLLNRRDWHDSLLPAGNLREEQNTARRATVIAIPADEADLESELRAWGKTSGWQGPIWKLHRHMEIPSIESKAVAFCGIARPEQFFSGLQAAGLQLADRIAFRDHHRYTLTDFQRLQRTMQTTGAKALVTTEKDRVRLGAIAESFPVHAVPLRTEIEDESAALGWLLDWLLRRLPRTESKPSV